MIATERNITIVAGNGHTFMFIYRAEHRTEMMQRIGRYASRPEVPFSWQDASLVAKEVIKNVKTTRLI